MKHFFLLKQYLIYFFKAKTAHGIHSPFVFDFIESILNDQRNYYAFQEIATRRKELLSDKSILLVEDFGAGSLVHQFNKQRTVQSIAQNAGRNHKFGKILFKIVDHYKRRNVIELGTSLGLGTCYLASACKEGNVITIEGSKEIAQKAKETFSYLNLTNIHQEIGKFDDLLPSILANNANTDLVFIDGNHQELATIRYFHQVLQNCNEDTILIFDDIHWSQGMLNAWETIYTHPRVTLSIDIFFFGIIFFKKEFKEKQHFILKY